MNKVYKINDKEFIQLVKSNSTYSDILKNLGLSAKGGTAFKLLKRRIEELKIDISHFESINYRATAKKRIPLEEILVENSVYQNISRLKIRLVNEKLMEYKCALCDNDGTWMDQELVLQLDHINGNNRDYRLKNLRFLCPNCHSLTNTYAGRNNKGV